MTGEWVTVEDEGDDQPTEITVHRFGSGNVRPDADEGVSSGPLDTRAADEDRREQ
jgi:hypothetical protein